MEALGAVLTAQRARTEALRRTVERLAADDGGDWEEMRTEARRALRLAVPPEPEPEIVAAWGCPNCGRIDAPQPCLGVCVYRPVRMTNAAEYSALADRLTETRAVHRELSALARLVATVRVRSRKRAPR